MNHRPAGLRFEDKLAIEKALLEGLSGRRDRRIVVTAAAVAIVLHVIAGLAPVPPTETAVRWRRDAPNFPELVRWSPSPARAASPAAAASLSDGIPAEVVPFGPPIFPDPEPVLEPVNAGASELPPEAEALAPPPALHAEPAAAPREPVVTRPTVAPGGRVEPVFPRAARRLRAGGAVLIEVEVLPDGSAGAVRVVRSTRPGIGFEDAAVAAVRKWRFNPGMRDGQPVASTLVVKVDFTW